MAQRLVQVRCRPGHGEKRERGNVRFGLTQDVRRVTRRILAHCVRQGDMLSPVQPLASSSVSHQFISSMKHSQESSFENYSSIIEWIFVSVNFKI